MKDLISGLEQQLADLPPEERSEKKVDLLNKLCRLILIENPSRGLTLSTTAEKMARELGYQQGLAYSIGLHGYSKYMMSDLEAALPELKTALKMAEETGSSEGMAEIYGGMAAVKLSLGNYEDALAYQLKAHEIILKLRNPYMEGWSFYNLGMGYHEWGDFSRALEYYQHGLKIFEKLESRQAEDEDHKYNELGKGRALTGIGTAYQSLGQYKKSLPYHQQSLEIFRKHDNKIGESRALNDLGTANQNLGDYQKALEYHRQSLKIREKIGNRQAECTSLINLGYTYLELDQIPRALEMLKKAIDLAEQIKAKPRVFQANRALSEVYQRMGDAEKALFHYKKYHEMKEQVSGDDTNARLKNLQINYEVESAEKIADIERLKNVELKNKNTELKKLLKELKETQSQLIQSEKMATLGNLVAGVMHEMNSPMGALNSTTDITIRSILQLKSFRDLSNAAVKPDKFKKNLDILEKNIRVLVASSERLTAILNSLRSFVRLDESPYQESDLQVDIDNTLTLIENQIPKEIKIEKKYEDIPRTYCYPAELNQVFMNLLTNAVEAIKDQGTITIHTFQKEGDIHLSFKDTGRGIPKKQLPHLFEPGFSKKGNRVKAAIGLFTSYNIIDRHQGKITVKSTPGNGSTFTVVLPVKSD